jgi:hypothetical protein
MSPAGSVSSSKAAEAQGATEPGSRPGMILRMTEDDVRALLVTAPVVESAEVSSWGNPAARAAIAVWPPAAELPSWRVVILKQTGAADDGVHAFRAAIEPGLIRLVVYSDLDLGDGRTWQQLPDGMWFAVEASQPEPVPMAPVQAPVHAPPAVAPLVEPPPDDPAWRWAQSVPVIESNELDVLALHQAGQIVITPTADRNVRVWAAYRPGLPAAEIAEFKRFVVERVYTFFMNGPQDGLWFKRRSDDGWQVTMTIRSGVR